MSSLLKQKNSNIMCSNAIKENLIEKLVNQKEKKLISQKREKINQLTAKIKLIDVMFHMIITDDKKLDLGMN